MKVIVNKCKKHILLKTQISREMLVLFLYLTSSIILNIKYIFPNFHNVVYVTTIVNGKVQYYPEFILSLLYCTPLYIGIIFAFVIIVCLIVIFPLHLISEWIKKGEG